MLIVDLNRNDGEMDPIKRNGFEDGQLGSLDIQREIVDMLDIDGIEHGGQREARGIKNVLDAVG